MCKCYTIHGVVWAELSSVINYLCAMSASSASRKRKSLSLEEKGDIIRKCSKGMKQNVIAKEYDASPAAISGILKKKDEIIQLLEGGKLSGSKKRMKPMKFRDVDEAMLLWLQEMRSKNVIVSGPTMLIKAEEYAKQYGDTSFKASQGWLQKFKQRHGVVCKTISGEHSCCSHMYTSVCYFYSDLMLIKYV